MIDPAPFRHVDLFSGIGGFSLAAQWVWGDEHEIVCFVEQDKFCQKVLGKHWPETFIIPDIKDIYVDIHGNIFYIDQKGDIIMDKRVRKELDQAKGMYESGMSVAECGEFYGISRQAMHLALLRRGTKMRTNQRGQKSKFKISEENQYVDVEKMDEAFVGMVSNAYSEGSSIASCSGKFGIGTHIVEKILDYKNVTKRTTSLYGERNGFYRGGVVEGEPARVVAYSAIKKGILIREPCEVCGAYGIDENGKNVIVAHHDDYNKPLDVRWLCYEHHYEWHKDNKAKEQAHSGSGRDTDTTVDLLTAGVP